MLRFYILFILIVFAHTSYSQSVNILVTMDSQPAPYSYIKINDNIIGMCDKNGKYIVDKDILKKDYKISAEFATMKSDDFIFTKDVGTINLNINSILITNTLVKGDRINTLGKYLNLTKNNQIDRSVNRFTYKFKIKFSDINKKTSSYTTGELDIVPNLNINTTSFDVINSSFAGDTMMSNLSRMATLIGYHNFKNILDAGYLKHYNKQKELLIQDKGVAGSEQAFLFISKEDQKHQMIIIDEKTGRVINFSESYKKNNNHYYYYIKPKYSTDGKRTLGIDSMKFISIIGTDSIRIEGDIYDIKLSTITSKQSQKLIGK